MMAIRRIAAVVVGAYVAMWVPAIFVRFVDVPFGVGVALLVLAAAFGGYGGYHEGRTLAPFSGREHRDAVVGWSIVLVPVGIIACFLVPMPWRIAAAALWVLAVVAIARALLADEPADSSPQRATGEPVIDRSTA